MTQLLLLSITLLFFSCSTTTKEERDIALESWKGHSVEDLKKHSYFRELPVNKKKHQDGSETWILRDQSRYQTSAYCQSLGGCMGMPYYNCDNAFSIKDGIIQAFEQNGTCPPIKTIYAPEKPKG